MCTELRINVRAVYPCAIRGENQVACAAATGKPLLLGARGHVDYGNVIAHAVADIESGAGAIEDDTPRLGAGGDGPRNCLGRNVDHRHGVLPRIHDEDLLPVRRQSKIAREAPNRNTRCDLVGGRV